MKKVEKDILEVLKNNSRMSIKDISSFVDAPESEVAEIIDAFEKNGTILQYTAVINERKLPKSKTRALVEVCISPEKGTGFETIAKRISNNVHVVDLYLIAGQYDFLLVVEGNSIEEISAFVYDKLATMDNIRSTSTHFFMKKYKEKGIVFEDNNDQKRLAVSP